jgi:hypothetical protein
MPVATTLEDMVYGDYSLNNTGGALFGVETVGSDLANTLLGGPAQGGSYTGGVGGGSSRTAEERQQSILDVNPYVRPGENINPNPVTSQRNSGQTGYYFANELGLPASYGNVGTAQAADPATFNPNAQYASQLPGFVPVDPNATYRLVSGGTDGNVVYSGTGAEGLRNVFVQANDLTLADPTNAYWGVEVLDPATGQYNRVAENRGPNGLGIIGDIAGFALPIAAAIATGGASLGVQIAAGAAAGGLGGFLSGNDILRSALLSGATAGLGNVTGLNEAVGGVLNDVGDAVSNAFVSGATNQAATNATGEIIVNALSNLARGVGAGVVQGAVGGAVGGATGATGTGTTSTNQTAEQLEEARTGDIVARADTSGATTGATATAGTTGLLNTTTGTGTTGTSNTTTGDTTTSESGGTNLSLLDILTLLGVGGDLLSTLLNNRSGTGTTSTYVSPFGTGAGTGLGTGQDMRANPNITDYERYGFGPEALFFTPNYSRVFSAGTPATQTQSSTTTNTNR